MSKSVRAGVITGVVLGGLILALVATSWRRAEPLHDIFALFIIFLMIYFAAASALLIRGVWDPELGMPRLVTFGVGLIAFGITAAFVSWLESGRRSSAYSANQDSKYLFWPSWSKEGQTPMGSSVAIASTVVSVALYLGMVFWYQSYTTI